MKNYLSKDFFDSNKQILRKMKMTCLMAIIFASSVFATNVESQVAKVNITLKGASISKVMDAIESQTDYLFVYNKSEIDINRKVDVDVKNQAVALVLSSIFNNTNVVYALEGTNIMLMQKNQLQQPGQPKQQQKTVSGTITDEKGITIPGVSIQVEGTTIGTVTDVNGKYIIELPSENGVLIFTFIGYTKQKIAVKGGTTMNVIMIMEAQNLDEVVVIGYGTIKKKDLTGAVSVVDTKLLKNKTVTTMADLLQGNASGVYVRGGSQPGQSSTVQIRGIKSLTNNNPLYVIDGLITDGSRDFNPSDIESIQVLKDASSAAIYGSRSANGVIVITTKKGKEGPMKVDFSVKKGIQNTPRYDLAGRDEFIRLNDMAYANAGLPPQDHRPDINTDWQDEIFRTGQIEDYNLSMSGGAKNSSYMVSGNYFANKGTLIGTEFERFTFRVNTEAKKGILKIGENLSLNNSYSTELPSLNPYWEVLRMLPTIPVYDEANPGGFGYGDGYRAKTFGSNPVALQYLQNRTNKNYRMRGNIFGEIEFLDGFKYRISYGLDADFYFHKYLRREGTWTMNQPANDPSELYEPSSTYFSSIIENTLSYTKKIKKHSVDAFIGTTYQSEEYETKGALTQNLLKTPDGDYFQVLDAGTSNPKVYGNLNEARMISYLGRVNYNYDEKYLFSATLRTDGSSRFKKDQRWGTFPSFSVGWRPLKESFIKVSGIDDLKLRANYGTLGSVNIGCYDYLPLININTPAIFNNTIINGATQVQLVNEDIKWETLIQQNYGADIALFKSRLNISAEYFIADSKNVLYGMPIATSTGNDGGSPVVNAADIRNNGFELTASWRDKVSDVQYNIGLNLSLLNNKVNSLGYGETQVKTTTTLSEVGEPMAMWYLIKTDGLFQNSDEIMNYKNPEGKVIQPDAKPGDIRFIDSNNDGKITNEDRQLVGSPWADFEAGLNLGAEWKNFDMIMNWFASVGGLVYNSPRQLTDRFDDNSNYRKGIQPWQKEGDNGFPRVVYESTLNSLEATDRWLENGSFIRLKEFSVGYNIPQSILKHISVNQCRISISGQNLLTFTKYTGLDPEFSGSLYERGRDFAAYPNAKTFTIGLSMSF